MKVLSSFANPNIFKMENLLSIENGYKNSCKTKFSILQLSALPHNKQNNKLPKSAHLSLSNAVDQLINKFVIEKFKVDFYVKIYSYPPEGYRSPTKEKQAYIVPIYINHPLSSPSIPDKPMEPAEMKKGGFFKELKKGLKSGLSKKYNKIKREYHNRRRAWGNHMLSIYIKQISLEALNNNLVCLKFFERKKNQKLLSLSQKAQKKDPTNIRSKLIELIAKEKSNPSNCQLIQEYLDQIPIQNLAAASLYQSIFFDFTQKNTLSKEKINPLFSPIFIPPKDHLEQKCLLVAYSALYENLQILKAEKKLNYFKFYPLLLDPLMDISNSNIDISSFFKELIKPVLFNDMKLSWNYLNNILDVFIFLSLMKNINGK